MYYAWTVLFAENEKQVSIVISAERRVGKIEIDPT